MWLYAYSSKLIAINDFLNAVDLAGSFYSAITSRIDFEAIAPDSTVVTGVEGELDALVTLDGFGFRVMEIQKELLGCSLYPKSLQHVSKGRDCNCKKYCCDGKHNQ